MTGCAADNYLPACGNQAGRRRSNPWFDIASPAEPLNVTPLGLRPDDCRGALLSYRRRVLGLRSLLVRWQVGERVPELPAAVEDLATHLEVDVRARASGPAREMMTRVETAVFMPALNRLWEFCGRLAPATPPSQWLEPLDSMDLELTAAETALSAWEHRHRYLN